MNIISYNVNGIRAAIKKGFVDWLEKAQPDVICLQETKAHKEQVDVSEIEKLGYKCYWNSAERKGYSGVAIFTKIEPYAVVEDTGILSLDGEGRIIRADFDNVSVFSLYVPNGGDLGPRLEYKMQFCTDFTNYIHELKQTLPNLVITGDYNICHQAIDIHDPVRNKTVSGFLPMEREWMTDFMEYCGMLDSFREFNKEPNQYTWWSFRANSRARNKGWRLDYEMVSKEMKDRMKRALILPEVKHSDHCPILLEIST